MKMRNLGIQRTGKAEYGTVVVQWAGEVGAVSGKCEWASSAQPEA